MSGGDGRYDLMRKVHARHVFTHRAQALSLLLAEQVRGHAAVLDIGCGSGEIGRRVMELADGVEITGLDIMKREGCLIPCREFDGRKIPMGDDAVDLCVFVDVLHHADGAEELLREAARVSRKGILIKDHLCESAFDRATLKFMDWVGNRPHGVVLPYSYLSSRQWRGLFRSLGLTVSLWHDRLKLYPGPANLIFGRGLHFIALVEKEAVPSAGG
jgi:ubiquinone/menaquinone biosynthesis C-methylase UbiE